MWRSVSVNVKREVGHRSWTKILKIASSKGYRVRCGSRAGERWGETTGKKTPKKTQKKTEKKPGTTGKLFLVEIEIVAQWCGWESPIYWRKSYPRGREQGHGNYPSMFTVQSKKEKTFFTRLLLFLFFFLLGTNMRYTKQPHGFHVVESKRFGTPRSLTSGAPFVLSHWQKTKNLLEQKTSASASSKKKKPRNGLKIYWGQMAEDGCGNGEAMKTWILALSFNRNGVSSARPVSPADSTMPDMDEINIRESNGRRWVWK